MALSGLYDDPDEGFFDEFLGLGKHSTEYKELEDRVERVERLMTPALTDPIRAYLKAAREGRYRLVDVIVDLTQHFHLTAREAGAVLAQDVMEQA